MNLSAECVTEYITEYYRPKNSFLDQLRMQSEEEHIPIILKETEVFFDTFLKILCPKKIFEIGTATGYSSIYFAGVLPDAEIWTVEKDRENFEKAKKNIEKAGFSDRIHVINADGEEGGIQIQQAGEKGFDFVFIDAAKSHYKRFLKSALPLCKEKAVIVSDNIWQHGITFNEDTESRQYKKHITNIRKMRDFVESMDKSDQFTNSLLNIGDGLLLSIYK